MSKFLKLSLKDFVKGLVVAVLTAILTFLQNELVAGSVVDLQLLKRVGVSAAIAFLAYLIKNLFTNNNDEILKPDKI